ncbi:UNVERIFIED_CONTAM: hypothetical protein HHA_314695 [Hammondia hammondi]|eukprot:XP_008883472.1 hypothetical protein HHA_314695 [Hammondia hammondi]
MYKFCFFDASTEETASVGILWQRDCRHAFMSDAKHYCCTRFRKVWRCCRGCGQCAVCPIFVYEERRIIWCMLLVGTVCYWGTAMQLRIVFFIAFNTSANMSGGYRLRMSPYCENRKMWPLLRKWICLCTSSRLLSSVHSVLMREAVNRQPRPLPSGRTVF